MAIWLIGAFAAAAAKMERHSTRAQYSPACHCVSGFPGFPVVVEFTSCRIFVRMTWQTSVSCSCMSGVRAVTGTR